MLFAADPTSPCTSHSVSQLAHPLPTFQRIGFFQAEVDFTTGTGKTDSDVAFAYWKDHQPGYLLSALDFNGGKGIDLPGGIYRWVFRLRRGSEPIQVSGS